jgi:YVTN family beta-propeller protein
MRLGKFCRLLGRSTVSYSSSKAKLVITLFALALGLVLGLQSTRLTLAQPDSMADRVYGQQGSFIFSGSNNGSQRNAGSLDLPLALAVVLDNSSSFSSGDKPTNSVSSLLNSVTTTTSLSSSDNPSVYGNNVTFSANVSPSTATGTVTFTEGATVLGTGTLSGGIATFSTSSLITGNHVIRATYGGDSNSLGSTSSNFTQTVAVATIPVGIAPVGVAVLSSTNRIYVANYSDNTVSVINGNTNDVIATIAVNSRPQELAINPTTNRLYVANWNSGTVSVIDITSNTVITNIPVGSRPTGIAVNPNTNRIYGANYDSENLYVIDGATNSVITNISVGSSPRGVAVNPNTNRVYLANGNIGAVTVVDGSTNSVLTTISLFPFSGLVDVEVNPNTNRVYVSSYDSGVAMVDGNTNTLVNISPSFTAAWDISLNTTTNRLYMAVSDANMVAVLDANTNSLVTTFVTGDTPKAPAINPCTSRLYVSNFYNSTLAVLEETVKSYCPTVSLTSALNPSSFGQSVTFTASVSMITATGTVTFIEGATTLGTATLNSGVATFTTSNLPVGNNVISAVYGGDNTYVGASSYSITQTVNRSSTTINLSSSLNPSLSGESVILTATLTPVTTNGSIIFIEGSTVLGTANLVSGVATYTTNSFSIGSHTISAVYGGNSNYQPSVSNSLTQIVKGPCDPLQITSSADDGSCGTLRHALSTASSGDTITITLSAGSTISLSNGSGLNLASDVSLITTAPCGANGPAITIQGSTGEGLTLSSGNSVYGIWIRGFSDRQLIVPAGGKNTLHCVKVSKT